MEDQTAQKIHHLLSFSADVIASLTLAPEYSLKKLAHDIDYLFGASGTLVPKIADVMPAPSE